jgi:hypothetical protein
MDTSSDSPIGHGDHGKGRGAVPARLSLTELCEAFLHAEPNAQQQFFDAFLLGCAAGAKLGRELARGRRVAEKGSC